MVQIRARVAALVNLGNRLSVLPALLIVCAISVVVKLAVILVLGGGLGAFPSEGTDATYYDRAARVLLGYGVFGFDPAQPITQPPPGEAAFLAGVYALSGGSLVVAKLAHVALLTGVVVLTYLSGRLLCSAAGFWAALLLALDPGQAYLAMTFLSEPLFLLLTLLGLYLLVRGQAAGRPLAWAAGAGVCLGLASLTRAQGFLLPLVLLAGALILRGRLLPWRMGAVVLATVVLVVAPWTYRNYRVSGHLIPIATNSGLNLWAGNNPEFGWRPPQPMSLPVYDAPTGLSTLELDSYYSDRATEWIARHPGQFLRNGLRKEIALFNFDPASSRPAVAPLFLLAGIFPYGLCLPVILLGLIGGFRDPRLRVILAHIGLTMVLAFIYWGDSRMRATIEPYLYLLGSAWVVARLLRGTIARPVHAPGLVPVVEQEAALPR